MKGLRDLRPFAGASAVVFAVISLAFALRLNALHAEEPGPDGHLSLALARESLPLALNFLLRDPHPPLYYLALKAWQAVAGDSIYAARWLSVACGLFSLSVAGRLARILAGPRAAVATVVLLAFAPMHIFASATVRDYAAGFALSLVALWLYPLSRPDGRGRLVYVIGLTLTTAAALLTWYFHAVFVLLQAALLVAERRRWRPVLLGLTSGVAIALPWVVASLRYLFPQFTSSRHAFSGAVISPVPLDVFAAWVTEATLGRWPDSADGRLLVIALVATTLSGWGLLVFKRAWMALAMVAGGSVVALGVAYMAVTRWAGPFPGNRAALPAAFFLLLSGALGWSRLNAGRWKIGALVPVLYVVPMIVSYQYQLGPFPYAQFPAIRTLPRWLQTEDAVLFTDLAWQEIFTRTHGRSVRTYAVHYVGTHSFIDEARMALERAWPELVAAKRVWVVSNGPEQFEAEAFLMQRLLEVHPLGQVDVLEDGTILRRYGPGPGPPPGPVGALFDGTYLLQTASLPTAAASGETLSVLLTWERVGESQGHYSVFVHLRDHNGRTVAQGDSWPSQGLRPTGTWAVGERVRDPHLVPLPQDLPPGSYHLVVGLSSGRGRLPTVSGDNEVILGQVLISP